MCICEGEGVYIQHVKFTRGFRMILLRIHKERKTRAMIHQLPGVHAVSTQKIIMQEKNLAVINGFGRGSNYIY